MRKKALLYIVVVASALSMQSCVTNYVVSAPATYTTEGEPTALKISENSKKELINSFKNSSKLASTSIDAVLKIEAIAKEKHAKIVEGLLSEAESYIGTPYRFGGTTRRGIDCSAFVLSVFGAAVGKSLPRVASAQSQQGEKISKENLQKGDLIFFSHGKGRISHVAIVYDVTPQGEVKFIHAATSRGVMISSLKDSYWAPKFRFAKRILEDENPNLAAKTN